VCCALVWSRFEKPLPSGLVTASNIRRASAILLDLCFAFALAFASKGRTTKCQALLGCLFDSDFRWGFFPWESAPGTDNL